MGVRTLSRKPYLRDKARLLRLTKTEEGEYEVFYYLNGGSPKVTKVFVVRH